MWCFPRLERRSGVPSIYERRFKKKPVRDVAMMRTFGALAFAYIKSGTRGRAL